MLFPKNLNQIQGFGKCQISLWRALHMSRIGKLLATAE